MGPNVYFRIISPDDHIELKFGTPQSESFNGWSIKPHITPCRVSKAIILISYTTCTYAVLQSYILYTGKILHC